MILHQAKIYVAACKPERIRKLPEQLEKLDLPYIIERELPSVQAASGVVFDGCSRRFRDQVLTDTETPLLWLEDDIDIFYNFLEVWAEYEKTLPVDWKVAVLGWGLMHEDGDRAPKIREVSPGWWHLEEPVVFAPNFSGTQATLVNGGEWRELFRDKAFRCDIDLCRLLKEHGIEQIYHTDKVLIGTCDPTTTFGDAVVQYPTMTVPKYWSWKELRYRDVQESDFLITDTSD